MRKYMAFVLLGILTVAGVGFAVLGVVQSKSGTDLGQAVSRTPWRPPTTPSTWCRRRPRATRRPIWSSRPPTGWAATLLASGHKTYLFIIGTTEYIAVTTTASAPVPTKLLHTEDDRGECPWTRPTRTCATTTRGPSTRSGSVTTVTLTQGGQKETLTYTVTGNYVSEFHAATPDGAINLAISDVGTSPPVALPKGYTITTTVPQG